MANGDVFRVTVKHAYTDVGIAVQHVLWFRQTSASPVAFEAAAVGQAVLDRWPAGGPNGSPTWLWAPAFQFQGVECQKMLDPFEAPVSIADTVPGVGADVFTVKVPSVCSMVVTLLSERGGRRGRGRVYLGGFAARRPNNPGFWPEAFALASSGQWSLSYQGDVVTWLNAFKAAFDGSTVLDVGTGLQAEWGVWSRAEGGSVPPFNPAGFSPMASVFTDGVIRVQRRREYGHGI